MYIANDDRYSKKINYQRCGSSGLLLPQISLGLWQNFSQNAPYERSREMLLTSFDNGITHFDLANNYGPPAGDGEIVFGKVLSQDLKPYRDELVISTKAGHLMWPGPYGDWASRKSLLSSLDQSLKRMNLDYVDIFYSHRYDPLTDLEETMCALDHAVKSGKALYVGLSKYPAAPLAEALKILRELRTPVLLHQVRYSMLVREPEAELFDIHRDNKVGCISFSPLAQGVLSSKYLDNIPLGSRASGDGTLKREYIQAQHEKIVELNNMAIERGQTLSQMAIAWQLFNKNITSVIVGASSKEQILENIAATDNINFSEFEIAKIDKITL